jgi:LacI family transcriptional regulator
MPTLKDIAARLGVAPSTISKALNGASDVSEELRQTILDTAVEMGYVTKKMKKEKHKKLCILVENMPYEQEDDFGFDLILGFKQLAQRDNWSIDVIPVTPAFQSGRKFDSFMLRKGYSGAFCMGFALQDTWMQQFHSSTSPVVLLDNYVPYNPNVTYVGTDNYEGMALSVSHLAALGHQKIAFLNGSENSFVTEERRNAFIQSMHSNHLTVENDLNIYSYFVSEAAKYHVSHFLERGVTAIICGNDLLASGVITECRQLGYRIPEDVSVIGFDDIPIAQTTNPPLTTIRQNRLQLGKCAYTTLNALMLHIPLSKTILRAQLVSRGSVAAACNLSQN